MFHWDLIEILSSVWVFMNWWISVGRTSLTELCSLKEPGTIWFRGNSHNSIFSSVVMTIFQKNDVSIDPTLKINRRLFNRDVFFVPHDGLMWRDVLYRTSFSCQQKLLIKLTDHFRGSFFMLKRQEKRNVTPPTCLKILWGIKNKHILAFLSIFSDVWL